MGVFCHVTKKVSWERTLKDYVYVYITAVFLQLFLSSMSYGLQCLQSGKGCSAHAQSWTGSKKLLKKTSIAENLHRHSNCKQSELHPSAFLSTR